MSVSQAMPPQGPEMFFINPTIDSPLMRYDTPLDDVWTHTRYTWEYRPNPQFEEFHVLGDINVDQVIVETWCTVPEPASMGLLGLGALALIRLRRRR